MNALFLVLAISGALLAAVFLVDRFGSAGWACTLAAVATIVSVLSMIPSLMLQSLITFVLCGICAARGASFGACTISAAVAMVVAYGLFAFLTLGEWNRVAEVAADYPLVSLEVRLGYENKEVVASEKSPLKLSVDAEHRLSVFESDRKYGNMRTMMLRNLHERSRLDFVVARGFGNARMLGVHRDWIDIPKAPPLLLPNGIDDYEAKDTPPLPGELAARERAPFAPGELSKVHQQSIEDFLNVERMGYVRSREEVAGFEPHRFEKMPAIKSETESWQVARLELISLLRHPRPVAYVSDQLPNMEALAKVATRPLNAFEEGALVRLWAEEDVVVEEAAHRIRMVGSLRAANDCRACHSVERGELLGALSYVLVRPKPAARPIPQPAGGTAQSQFPRMGAS